MAKADANVELSKSAKGVVKQTISNCVIALLSDEKTRSMFRYNELTGKVEVTGAWWKKTGVNLSQVDENNIRWYLENFYELSSEKNIPRAINIIANQNSYHPIRDYLDGLQWDGIERIKELFPRYLGAERSAYTTETTKLFLLGALERIYKPGCKFDSMICLVEDKQGGGKSTMARFLAINDEWFTDDLRNLEDENVYRKLSGHWIVEFSEMLATQNAKTVEAIKSFISRQKDVYKVPYDKYPEDYPRQCVFIGTTNNNSFLPKDRTGNRRFIPIAVNSANAEVHPLQDEQETRSFIKMCWAEAMEIRRSGNYELKLSAEMSKELEQVQESFKPEDAKAGIIQEWLDNCDYTAVCSTMIYYEAFADNAGRNPQRWELTEISEIMNKSVKGWIKYPKEKKRFNKYGVQRAWIKENVAVEVLPDGFETCNSLQEMSEVPFK